VWVVAELSANHGGSLARALETIEAAAECGADAIKLQTYTADTLTIDCDREPFQIRSGPWRGRTLYDLYREAATPWEWHGELRAAARRCGVPLFSTPFDPSAVDFLEELGVPAHKIASFEIIDRELVERVAVTGKPLLVSTGMASDSEVAEAVGWIRSVWGRQDPGLALLHCVSAYPAAPEDMQLATIPALSRRFQAVPGLSDHSLGNLCALASIPLGARIVEKHFTLRRSDGGPDAAFSIEPAELRGLVQQIRQVERAIGGVREGPRPSEADSLCHRRSLFVVRDLRAGEVLSRENLRVIRPAGGLAPKEHRAVLGRRVRRSLQRDTPLRWEDLEPQC